MTMIDDKPRIWEDKISTKMEDKLRITDKATGAIVVYTTIVDISEVMELELSNTFPRASYLWETLTPTGTKVLEDVPVVVDSDMTDEERNAAAAANLDDVVCLKSLEEIDLSQRFPVVETFNSIQGEGAFIGMPTTFIRLAGCDMGCPWCDSRDTWKIPNIDTDFQVMLEQASNMEYSASKLEELDHSDLNSDLAGSVLHRRWMSIQELVKNDLLGIVVITGGEPCIHENLQDLVLAIKYIQGKENVIVCIETNGAQATPEGVDWVVCSPKSNNEYKIHPECQWNELKYVVDETFEPTVVPASVLSGEIPAGSVWLQPCDQRFGMSIADTLLVGLDENLKNVYKNKFQLTIMEATASSWKRCYALAMEYKCFRVGIQLHKFMDAR